MIGSILNSFCAPLCLRFAYVWGGVYMHITPDQGGVYCQAGGWKGENRMKLTWRRTVVSFLLIAESVCRAERQGDEAQRH